MNYYMIWFAGIVVMCFGVAFFSRTIPRNRLNIFNEPIPNLIGFLIPAAAFGIFSGLRSRIGDTLAYINSYYLLDPETMDPVRFQFRGGTLFPWIQYLCRLRSPEPYQLIMITALVAIVPAVYVLYKYACPYELAIALFVLTGYYSFSMNGIRQYAAAGILLMGTKYLFSEKKIDFFKYALFVLAAWLFHSSAPLMLVVYFIVRRKAWTPLTFILLFGTAFITLIFDTFLPSFLNILEDTDFAVYAEGDWFTAGEETGSNIIRIFVLMVPLVLAYMERFHFRELYGRKWDILVNLSVLNLAFYVLSLYNWIFARLAIYTSLYVIIMMTYLITHGSDRNTDRWLYPVSVVLYSGYFYFISYSITDYQSDLF